MRIKITEYDQNSTIMTIKAIRFNTGLGLKESKDIIDAVKTHGSVCFSISNVEEDSPKAEEIMYRFSAAGIIAEILRDDSDMAKFLHMLNKYPEHLTVGEVIDATRTAIELFGNKVTEK